ncbi:hypothetical protein OJF2_02820 [Aquisphaera giovannonii]|uniref:Nickel uptake substrate-specific transmembrane region n=1 Tax=Aquisphaera giovannonii TaxID=406548 RepID=A0A5B9VV71_9BACT|nr:DUF4198 domain-containing protein [Aquisphaera giovannonii]QEH31817.1 hypothetical protein OJF2_02820 [Aquisphaera giovannonii]
MPSLATPRPLIAACLMAALAGCSPGTPAGQVPVHPARGQVLYKGKPMPNLQVTFRTVGAGGGAAPKAPDVPTPTGRTDADGRFQLHTYLGNDGAPAGPYLVGIVPASAPSEARNVMQKGQADAPPRAALDAIRARYADPERSGLKAEIKDGDNDIPPFDLK